MSSTSDGPSESRPLSRSDCYKFLTLIHEDIRFADTKAAFAMSLTALGVGGAASFFGSLNDSVATTVFSDTNVTVACATGVLFTLATVVLSALVIIPRRYFQIKHPGDKASRTERAFFWLSERKTWLVGERLCDCAGVVWGSIPFVMPRKDSMNEVFEAAIGAIQSRASDDGSEPLEEEATRLVGVRRRKNWWVGPSVFFGTIAILSMLIGVALAVRNISRDFKPQGGQPARTVSPLGPLNTPSTP